MTPESIFVLIVAGLAMMVACWPPRQKEAPACTAKTDRTVNRENGVVVSMEHYRNTNRQYLD